jgi:hypothetical protein
MRDISDSLKGLCPKETFRSLMCRNTINIDPYLLIVSANDFQDEDLEYECTFGGFSDLRAKLFLLASNSIQPTTYTRTNPKTFSYNTPFYTNYYDMSDPGRWMNTIFPVRKDTYRFKDQAGCFIQQVYISGNMSGYILLSPIPK